MNKEILNSKIVLENKHVQLIPFEHFRNIELKEIVFDNEY